MSGRNRQHYGGDYTKRAKIVVRAAYANKATLCGRCGLTLAQHKPGSTWDAGHINDGQIGGPLRPEVSGCNRAAGARLGNQRRKGLQLTQRY